MRWLYKELKFNEDRVGRWSGVPTSSSGCVGHAWRRVGTWCWIRGKRSTISNDSVTIAREIGVEDVFENQGAQLVLVATSTNDVAGDGTTTTAVLAQAIVREGLKNVAAGANPMGLKRGIERAVEPVVEHLKTQSKEISGKEEIARVATVSSRDPEIGDVMPTRSRRSARTAS